MQWNRNQLLTLILPGMLVHDVSRNALARPYNQSLIKFPEGAQANYSKFLPMNPIQYGILSQPRPTKEVTNTPTIMKSFFVLPVMAAR